MPREIRIAVILAVAALAMNTGNDVLQILADPEAAADSTYRICLAIVAFGPHAITALFILFVARRKHWARTVLLIWTLGPWLLLLFYPIDWNQYYRYLNGFSWLAWLTALSVWIIKFTALYLLFFGRGAVWFRKAEHAL